MIWKFCQQRNKKAQNIRIFSLSFLKHQCDYKELVLILFQTQKHNLTGKISGDFRHQKKENVSWSFVEFCFDFDKEYSQFQVQNQILTMINKTNISQQITKLT